MIRFSCPHCQREYELHDAMFGLPLICKGCGQRLAIPAPEPDAPPTHERESEPVKQQGADAPRSPEPPPTPIPDAAKDDDGFLSPETIARLDRPLEAPPMPKAWEKPVPAPQKAEAPKQVPTRSPRSNPKLIGIAADVAVVLVLLVVGVFLGEIAAGKSTREVMDGASGPKFPPLELLMWLAGPALLLLVYALLGARGKTVGAWLRRKLER